MSLSYCILRTQLFLIDSELILWQKKNKFKGIDGKYIIHYPQKTSELEFFVDPNLDQTLKEFTNQLLDLARTYTQISKYVDEISFASKGSPVAMCFAGAIRPLLKKYILYVGNCLDEFKNVFLYIYIVY